MAQRASDSGEVVVTLDAIREAVGHLPSSPGFAFSLSVHPPQEIVSGAEYVEEKITVDYFRFESCSFMRCELSYLGVGRPEFVDCSFDECTWSFDHAAGQTIEYLRSLVEALGPESDKVVDALLGRELVPTR